jgi:hydrogenase nickel incorporation protein HypA/HybF
MHEASLAGGVLQVVEDAARREGFVRLLALRLEAGQLAGVDARALRFALESITPGTLLEGARIDIDEPPGQAWCMACSRSVAIQRRGDSCPNCGGFQLQPTGGLELRVVDMHVNDIPVSPSLGGGR